MADVISFEEAVNRTEGQDCALLIGNGFSAEYFKYSTLLDESGLEVGTSLRNVFAALKTVDFEAVVGALEAAAIVERAYGNEAHAEELVSDAQKVREGLVCAINETHPKHRSDLSFKYDSSAAFLSNFVAVYSLNYDLLLYWVNLEKQILRDGFGFGTRNGRFIGPFSERADCHVFNLHGGLHLFGDGSGEIIKAVDSGDGVIATITDTISKKHRLPLYVAEGTSAQKMRKINSVAYLRLCYDALRSNAASIFIYGHSADDNDAHVYRAIFESKARHVYFGVYEPNPQKVRDLDGQLAKYQKSSRVDKDYTFFDSESAAVWST